MKLQLRAIIFLIVFFLFNYTFSTTGFAASYSLSGSVENSSGVAITNATINVYTPGTTNEVISPSTSDASGNYSFSSIPEGAYDIKVTPPPGQSFSSVLALNQNISDNTILNFILTPAGIVQLTGHVNDSSGAPLENQKVTLTASNNTQTSVLTDVSGSYTLQASSGNYGLSISGNTTNLPSNVPQQYLISFTSDNGGPFPISLTQSTILDVTLPAKAVTIHVQDSSETPVSNVAVSASLPGGGTKILGNIGDFIMVSNDSKYGGANGPLTDENGNVILWVLPSDNFTFTATPPSGSNYLNTSLSNRTISNDTNETITLLQPVTLSGHIYDSSGAPLANQSVTLTSSNNSQTIVSTNASGSYLLHVSPGNFGFTMSGNTTNLPSNVPQQYLISFTSNNGGPFPIALSQDTTLDVTLPAKEVRVHIQDAIGNPISGVAVGASLPGGGTKILGNIGDFIMVSNDSKYGGTSGPLTDGNGNVTLWVLPSDNIAITSTSPNESNFQSKTISNINISDDAQITVTLEQPVTLSGHIYDSSGAPLENQNVTLTATNNSQTHTTTDASGMYTLQVSSGNFGLSINDNTNNFPSYVPQEYLINFTSSNGGPFPITLTQSTTLDITLPAKQVTVHVQDTAGTPLSGIAIGASLPNGGTKILGNIDNFIMVNENSRYGGISGPFTDQSGNATLWLLPHDHYTFTAIPPNGSPYSSFTLNDVVITSDQTELISLQYSHTPPTTTATLSPAPNSSGDYPNPTTITLSATASPDYTIANTYYTIDGGSQQTYSSPFTISNIGNHTITYWSVDNTGVQESHHTKTFTITATPTPTPQLTTLNPAKIWIGLKNSDDIGIKLDLKAEVYKDNILITSGQLNSVPAGSNGFAHARLNTIPFNTFSPTNFPSSSQLTLKLYARNACTGSGKNSGTARLWYNDAQANSKFTATIASNTTDYFLLNNSILGTSTGIGPKLTSDISAGAKCSPFKSFGTWTITP